MKKKWIGLRSIHSVSRLLEKLDSVKYIITDLFAISSLNRQLSKNATIALYRVDFLASGGNTFIFIDGTTGTLDSTTSI